MKGKKAIDFSSQPIALGVQFNLEQLGHGRMEIKNKPGRIDRILELVKQVRDGEGRDRSTIASLAGLINFAGGFVLGHHFKLGSQALNAWASKRHSNRADVEQVCDYLEVVANAVQPKTVALHDTDAPWVIYTDGAFENQKGTWGALAYDR